MPFVREADADAALIERITAVPAPVRERADEAAAFVLFVLLKLTFQIALFRSRRLRILPQPGCVCASLMSVHVVMFPFMTLRHESDG